MKPNVFRKQACDFLCFCSSSSRIFLWMWIFSKLIELNWLTILYLLWLWSQKPVCFIIFTISSQAMSARQLWCETRWQIFAWDDETKLILLRLRLIFVSQQLNFLFLTPLASHQKRRFASKFVWTVLDDVTAQCSCPPRTCRLLAIFSLTVSLRWANSLPISLSLL